MASLQPSSRATHETDAPTRVLVVDDEQGVQLALSRALGRMGCVVVTASSGAEALNAADAARPQVAFVDLRMPMMDGHTVLRRLLSTSPTTAIVVMSGRGEMEDVIDVLRAGAADYLRKPWAPAELMGALTRGIELHERSSLRDAGRGSSAEPSPIVAEPARPDPFAALVSQLRSGDIPLPPVPSVIEALRRSVRDVRVDADRVVALIEQDPRIASDVLRVANTTRFAGGGRATTIKVAVLRLGFRQLHAIVETVFARAWVTSTQGPAPVLLDIWRYSVARALAMRALAEALPAGRAPAPDDAYLAGLLADVGASFLHWAQTRTAGVSSRPLQLGEAQLAERHGAFAGAILDRWQLPAPMSRIAVGHHDENAERCDGAMWSVCVLAGHLVEATLKRSDPTMKTPAPAAARARACEIIGVDDGLLASVQRSLGADLSATLDAMG